MAFLDESGLQALGLSNIGQNVLISDKAVIYGAERISVGSNVRIDDFCLISAGEDGIIIGNNVHIACYVSLIGAAQIILDDYVGLSSKVAVYSSSDDYSGQYLTNPTIPGQFRNVDSRPVYFGAHSLIGAGSIILPGVTVGEGTAVGALSLIRKSLPSWGIYAGTPITFIKNRGRNILSLADLMTNQQQ